MSRVAVLCEFATLNGGEHSLLSVLPHVAASYEVVVIAPPAGPLVEALARLGIPHLPFDANDANGRRLSQAALRAALRALLARLQCDLLHANSLAMGRLSGPVAAELRLRSVAHLRDIVGLSAQAVADLNRHRRLLAVSHATRRHHVAQGLDEQRVQVLYNGVDLSAFSPRPRTGRLHAELGLPAGAMLVGNIGQLIGRKGQDVLLAAAARLRDALPTLHFVLVGARYSRKAEAEAYEARLHEQAAAAGMQHRLHFLGVRGDVPELLNELDLLAHTARQEPLGRVLLEAAASGLPIIASDVGGTREIFPPECGAARLVPPGDAALLAEAIAQLALSRGERDSLAVAARRRAEQQFDSRQAAAALIAHYQAVLA